MSEKDKWMRNTHENNHLFSLGNLFLDVEQGSELA